MYTSFPLAPREVKAKVADFSFALSPQHQPGFLDRKLASLVQNTALQGQYGNDWSLLERATGVTVVGLDRSGRLIALDVDRRYPTLLDDLTNAGIADFSQNVMLDPVHKDFFTDKLLAALRAVGNPPMAANRPLVQQAQAWDSGPCRRGRATSPRPPISSGTRVRWGRRR